MRSVSRTDSHMTKRLYFTVLHLLFLVACSGSTAETRLQSHFQLSRVGTPEEIERELITKVGAQASEQSIYKFLDRSRIGSDGLSSYCPADSEGLIVCRIELDPHSAGIVKSSYGLFFQLDEQRRLKSLAVKKWLTGP